MEYYLITLNTVGFLLMYLDKYFAIHGKWRISEKNLILLASLGGAIGSIVGMYCFRHKTKHNKFKIGLPIILVTQITLFYILKGF